MARQKPLSEWTEAELRTLVSREFARNVRPIANSLVTSNTTPSIPSQRRAS